MDVKTKEINWQPAWRIIPSRFPTINLFENVSNPEDLEAVYQLESMTNDRIRDEVGDLQLVPPEERISGPGTSIIMAAFTHLNPLGSRFSDGSFGVFYAANTLQGAVAETRYHRERFFRLTHEKALEIDMRVYQLNLIGTLHDISDQQKTLPEMYHSTNYQASQRLGRELREQGAAGIAYTSVRYENGINAAVFRPKILRNCQQERHLCYVWNGERITTIYQKELWS